MEKEKNYIFYYKADLSHYTADALTIRCVDDRFWKPFKQYLRSLSIKHLDPKSPAGGAKVFSSPEKESDTDFMLRDIEKSIKLHAVTRVMIFNHHDCGAYGGFKKFEGNLEKELDFHTNELHKAKEVIRERFPELEIDTYFIDAKGIIKTA